MTYKLKKNLEADYGCEERPAGYVPQVLVILQDEAGNQIEREVTDAPNNSPNIKLINYNLRNN